MDHKERETGIKRTKIKPPKLEPKAIGQHNKAKVVFSFFAGAGFLDLGFEKKGFEIAFVNEIYEPFLKAYQHSRKRMRLPQPTHGYHKGDMADLTHGKGKKMLSKFVAMERKRGIVGFIGGPPCPDFSTAGRNLGREGQRGKLSATYTSLIIQQKPDFFLFENVKGMWRTTYHREYYDELKAKLEKCGYVTDERLINALEYGVPQDRDRIILVGFRKEMLGNAVANKRSRQLPKGLFPWDDFIKYQRTTFPALIKTKKNRQWAILPKDTTVGYWFKQNDVLKHPNAKHYFKPQAALKRFQTIKEGNVSGKSFKRLHRNRYSPTVAYGNNEVHVHPTRSRRLSVAESLAVQSLPKTFTLPGDMTLSSMFKAISNGVPYIAAKGIAGTITKFLDSI